MALLSEEQAAAQRLKVLDREWLAAMERTRANRARDEGRIKRNKVTLRP